MSEQEVWVLGGTGRVGRGVAAHLGDRGERVAVVGRDGQRLLNAKALIPDARAVVVPTPTEMAAAIVEQRPAVVVNTIGPFTVTADPVIEACLVTGSHYVDLANDVASVLRLIARHDTAVAAGCTLVTGAGFGVTATESALAKLCEGRPAPDAVRVDMVPSMAQEAGVLGEALAATLIDGLPDTEGGGRYDGRRYAHGRMAKSRLAGDPERLTLPSGEEITTATMPLGELVAAHRISGAADVTAASSEVPASTLIRVALPVVAGLLAIAPIRDFTRRRLARVRVRAREAPRAHSWGHARAKWSDGSRGDAWVRLGEAQAYTNQVCAEVAVRLLTGDVRPGAFTPVALFGPALAEACGGEYLLSVSAGPARR